MDKRKEEHHKAHTTQIDKKTEKILKPTKEKHQVTYKGFPRRLTAMFVTEIL